MRTAKRGGRRWTPRRVAMWAVCLLIGGLIAGELGARYIVGLGDPPLFVLDPEIEYLLRPDQRCRRFGHDYVVNSHSMRSEEFVLAKPVGGAGQLRVMVIGDSIVNGGGRIDQAELATSILQRALGVPGKSQAIVGNISAPSWGPPNQLAYAKRFGVFDADVVIIVSNSDDWEDVPGVEYIGSAWPRVKPWCALQELVGVYGWKAMCKVMGIAPEPRPPVRTATHEQDVERCRVAYGELIALARTTGAKVAVVQYLKRSELRGGAGGKGTQAGYAAMKEWATAARIEPWTTAEMFGPGANGTKGAVDPFQPGDDIHPNAAGQRMLAELLRKVVEREVGGGAVDGGNGKAKEVHH